MKRLPIGISDFKNIINGNYVYIDKTTFIREIMEDGAAALLLPRPRRFGKTLNMSMLRYFFENTEESNKVLFDGLNVSKDEKMMAHQGKYPLIYITFKDAKAETFEKCLEKIKDVVAEEYRKYKSKVENYLDETELIYYKKIASLEGTQVEYELSLKYLSKFLKRVFNKNVIILIDEYDIPIQESYMKGYYDDSISFMRNFLSGGLKDNENLEKAVLTGILRVAKEIIFSGLNNLKVCTLMNNPFSDCFGFTENEVEKLLKYKNIEFEMDEIKEWYNGYIFGEEVIYNPWSILNYVDNYEKGLMPYWVNTSSNDLIKRLLAKGGESVKSELEDLIKGEELVKEIDENIVMHEIDKDSESLWNFLLFSGYLKVVKKELKKGRTYCSLKIPNLEVKYLYEDIIMAWFKESLSSDKFNRMLKSLIEGDIETFSKIFKEFVLNSVSYFDVTGKEGENVYHAFTLGMLVALSDDYEVKSNRESGYGRHDVMVIPKDINKFGIVMEFKKVDEDENENLDIAAEKGLKQIEEKKYRQELLSCGIKNIIELGIGFEKKRVVVRKRVIRG